MDSMLAWLAACVTGAALLLYEVTLALAQRRRPERVARFAHAGLREQWFAAVSEQAGTEILAVQTLRNALMSASMTASTAALALMGTLALAVPALHAKLSGNPAWRSAFEPWLAMELVLLALLFASLASSVMAVRYYNHASFIGGMPIGSVARKRWTPAGAAYVRRAGVLYGWGLRQLLLVAPVTAFMLHPAAGPIAVVIVLGVLWSLDKLDPGHAGLSREPEQGPSQSMSSRKSP
jgi:hypothetical protein